MDIEGYEGPAIAAAKKLFSEKRPTILFELHSEQLLESVKSNRREVLKQLTDYGYEVFAINTGRHMKISVDRTLFRSGSSLYDQSVTARNSSFVGIPTEKLELYRHIIN